MVTMPSRARNRSARVSRPRVGMVRCWSSAAAACMQHILGFRWLFLLQVVLFHWMKGVRVPGTLIDLSFSCGFLVGEAQLGYLKLVKILEQEAGTKNPITWFPNQAMLQEALQQTGATPYECTDTRRTNRSGYKNRSLKT